MHITPSGADELDPPLDNKVVVTTSTIENWLWRGDDLVVKQMNLSCGEDSAEYAVVDAPRYIEVASRDYKLFPRHRQRVARKFRAPLFEGYTIPAHHVDAE